MVNFSVCMQQSRSYSTQFVLVEAGAVEYSQRLNSLLLVSLKHHSGQTEVGLLLSPRYQKSSIIIKEIKAIKDCSYKEPCVHTIANRITL